MVVVVVGSGGGGVFLVVGGGEGFFCVCVFFLFVCYVLLLLFFFFFVFFFWGGGGGFNYLFIYVGQNCSVSGDVVPFKTTSTLLDNLERKVLRVVLKCINMYKILTKGCYIYRRINCMDYKYISIVNILVLTTTKPHYHDYKSKLSIKLATVYNTKLRHISKQVVSAKRSRLTELSYTLKAINKKMLSFYWK